MKACFYDSVGAPDVLQVGDVDKPQAGPGEVLVRVMFSGLNPTDLKRRGGARGVMPFPKVIPHFDGSGVVVSVGAGVSASRIGQNVWIWEGQRNKPFGTCAEFVSVPETRAMLLPDKVSFEVGASVGVVAMTAARALTVHCEELQGEPVLITGGAGGVGNAAIRIAKLMGASVITTVSSLEKAKLAKDAGADHVINYREESIADKVLDVTGCEGVAHMVDVDLAAHLPHAWQYIRSNGSIASYGSQSSPEPQFPFAKYMYRNISLFPVAVFDIPEEEKLPLADLVQRAVQANVLAMPIDKVFALNEVQAAHSYLESGAAMGKVLIGVDG